MRGWIYLILIAFAVLFAVVNYIAQKVGLTPNTPPPLPCSPSAFPPHPCLLTLPPHLASPCLLCGDLSGHDLSAAAWGMLITCQSICLLCWLVCGAFLHCLKAFVHELKIAYLSKRPISCAASTVLGLVTGFAYTHSRFSLSMLLQRRRCASVCETRLCAGSLQKLNFANR